ncbi:NUDIX domain-containing protein [Owenweeksia hongkongensis]|uniref:NUDIX domain-containing protein n=1 Tax=Owenweeksia hongkongensis TaxID=253245 RepID=UPI003A9150FC
MRITKTEVTTDVVIIKIENGNKHILLIQRKNDPHKGKWALPGGFVETDETIITAAVRELKEETGIKVSEAELRFIGYFDNPNRDPRGRIISFAFAAEVPTKTKYNAADDANKAQWFLLANLPDLAFDHQRIIESI